MARNVSCIYDEGLNSKVKLSLYRTFSKKVGFKSYLHGVSDTGSRILFRYRSARDTWVE